MTDPVTLAIATAVVGKTAESLTDQAKDCLTALAARIREKFRDQPEKGAPELATALELACAQDPEFGAQIRALWDQIRAAGACDNVVNVFSGRADKVVQLRDVHGDVHLT
jgi:hypothetical protein